MARRPLNRSAVPASVKNAVDLIWTQVGSVLLCGCSAIVFANLGPMYDEPPVQPSQPDSSDPPYAYRRSSRPRCCPCSPGAWPSACGARRWAQFACHGAAVVFGGATLYLSGASQPIDLETTALLAFSAVGWCSVAASACLLTDAARQWFERSGALAREP